MNPIFNVKYNNMKHVNQYLKLSNRKFQKCKCHTSKYLNNEVYFHD